ncbi:uncharacterized protein BDV17DRAFT_283353 [Aspergillus undulatus]|uniref:uncharacterized protein n=1 Tax=Aspergillus undulatus TaxID=1810928 RepID=UPI003CCCDAF0
MTVSHLVRRGVEAFSTAAENGDVPKFQLQVGSPVLFTLLLITCIGFTYAALSVEYTYGLLVPTLAAVEDSKPDLYVRVDDDPNKLPGDPVDLAVEAEAPASKPITSKLRTTIRHLRARGGRLARFRGLSMFLTCMVAESFVSAVVPIPPNSVIGRFVLQMVVSILLANFQVAWVHIVISEPSAKRFYRRIPSFRSLKKIVPAAAFEHLLTNGAYFVTLLFIQLVHGVKELDDIRNGNGGSPETYRNALNIITIAGLVSWLASFPARVIFIRVAASMLPDEDEAIVPFDRSFGGKVEPSVVGSGVLSIADAWKTFDRDGWKRYLKSLAKSAAIQLGIAVLFSTLVVLEVLGGALTFKESTVFSPVLHCLPLLPVFFNTPPPLIAMATTPAGRMLARQLQHMQSDKDLPGISCGLVDNNVFEWEVMLMISDDVKLYGGGFFRARLSFPSEYPHMPPKMKFEPPLFHPNIYPNGEVCISILHPPEEDKYGYESAAERWSPVQTPETILLSVISMLSSPNDESAANVEAARLWREDPKEFKKRVRKCVRDSLGEE